MTQIIGTAAGEIAAANERFMNTFNRGDANALAKLYTDDGELLPATSDAVRGQHAIEGFWRGVMRLGVAKARLETVELELHDDTAIEIGRYSLFDAGGTGLDRGKYLVVWKRTAHGWRLHRDIWTTSLPAG